MLHKLGSSLYCYSALVLVYGKIPRGWGHYGKKLPGGLGRKNVGGGKGRDGVSRWEEKKKSGQCEKVVSGW